MVMKKSINRSVFALITLCVGLSGSSIAFGAEVYATSKNAIGATDFYQVNCSDVNTDHLSLRIKDQTPGNASSASILPQYVNLNITKDSITSNIPEISPGEQVELDVSGGMGPYQLYLETKGPERGPDNKKLKQTIAAEYVCLNEAGGSIKPAKYKIKKLNNNKLSKFSVKCGKNKKLSIGQQETAKLHVKFTNTTAPVATVDPAQVALNAQIIKGNLATNATDFNGDDVNSEEASLTGGAGIYSMVVNNTAHDSSQGNSRDYKLQYSCRDSAGNEIATGPAVLVSTVPEQ